MLIEEAYEVLDALDSGDPAELKDELGDLLFQVVFHAQISRERKNLTWPMSSTVRTKKWCAGILISSANADLKTAEDVLKNWEDIKAAEKGVPSSSHPDAERSLLDGIPSKLPALHRAYQMTAKASRVGFDWSQLEDILQKLQEETSELLEAHAQQDAQKVADEIGRPAFCGRKHRPVPWHRSGNSSEPQQPEIRPSFPHVESAIKRQGRELKDASLAEMDALWEEAKKQETDARFRFRIPDSRFHRIS